MGHEKRIIEAFKSNAITKILLIDDAYDPPKINEDTVAELADFLDSQANCTVCVELGIEEGTLNAAATAARDGEADSDELEKLHRLLYEEFSRTGKGFDPDGRFNRLKGPALAVLRPLCALLYKCGEKIEVRTAGLEEGMECYRKFRPQVLFLDYYLGDDVPTGGDANSRSKTRHGGHHKISWSRRPQMRMGKIFLRSCSCRPGVSTTMLISIATKRGTNESCHSASNFCKRNWYNRKTK